ncbi:hypothetical protein OG604_24515 [Streptomyces sp. NBC_01231]|nr:hypothetical protein OG604_24515 [Streptomyces sp. NBC_01231]
MERLADAELERGYAFEAVLLMGDAETISAARTLQRHAWVLEQFVRDMRSGTTEDWTRAFRQFQEKRDEYYVAARESLGVSAAFRLRAEDPVTLGQDPRRLQPTRGAARMAPAARALQPTTDMIAHTLSNCVGGVVSCVRGRSPAFMGGSREANSACGL